MSFETWMDEFYPVDAVDVPKNEAVAHSLRKWRGLTQENLEKHGVTLDGRVVREPYTHDLMRSLWIDGYSCALCIYYHPVPGECSSCPLYQYLGYSCDTYDYPENRIGPYAQWSGGRFSDPLPMIEALEACLEDDDGDI